MNPPQPSPFACRHGNLKLEQDRPGYLTGWYICPDCGERVGTSGTYPKHVQEDVQIFLRASEGLIARLQHSTPLKASELALVESHVNHITSLIAVQKSHETLDVSRRPNP